MLLGSIIFVFIIFLLTRTIFLIGVFLETQSFINKIEVQIFYILLKKLEIGTNSIYLEINSLQSYNHDY
jgi:hypothetical protein